MKDYGEPWSENHDGAVVTRDNVFVLSDECRSRAVACVNALSGIPTERLGEVKKAWENYIAQKECK